MSMIRPIAWMAAVWLVLQTATASGQLPNVPLLPKDQQFSPFIDPGYFQPDFQFFAPAEVYDFGGEEKPNYGLYVTFDRTYVNVSRPIDRFSFGSGNQGDFTWGNRMEIGYMMDDPAGWQGVLWHVNGPNEDFANAEFIEFIQTSDGASIGQVFTPGAFSSLNQLKMSSFELNRVWRLKEFHNGSILEPLLGYRYMNVRDYFEDETLLRAFVGAAPRADATDEFFEKISRRATFENNMHGGQLGGRLFRQRGHWLLSAEVRFFAMANFQTLRRVRERSVYPNPDELDFNGDTADLINPIPGTGGDLIRSENYDRASQFVWGGEVRGEAAYELTRDINLRFGFVFFDLGQGIGRGNLIRLNNQGVQMAGVTFGFTVNR
jgi:hypothetical protein